MKAKKLIEALANKLKTRSQVELAAALGTTVQTLHNWKNQDKELSPLQVASALAKAQRSAITASQRQTIKPLAEFYAIERSLTKKEMSWQIFPSGKESTLYAQGLRQILEESRGVYIFYDSRGQALYAGKARQQSLWKEMNLAFNRPREVQSISLVSHPDRNQKFKPGYEKLRQPKSTQLDLADLAYYFSAYRVDLGMIDDLEALIVRGFANDLLNIKMETFASTRDSK